jgi:tRNA (guanine37-N1)-methyltransferase
MIKFDIVTLFPQLFSEHISNLPFKRAVEKNIAQYNLWNLREFAIDKRGTVDDKTYGGGVGMILMIEPIYKALEAIYGGKPVPSKTSASGSKIVLLSPRGEMFSQRKAEEFSKCDQITLLCGRYEGMDARVEENLVTDVISIGNYVVSGGELPALTIMESVTRLLPGVLEKEDATKIESFADDTIEFPQYTRPEDFKGMKVPEVLLNGNHKEIDKWRQERSKKVF